MIRSFLLLLCWLPAVLAEPVAAEPANRHPLVGGVLHQLERGENGVRVVCFGDSITGVYYHTGSQRAWADLVGLALRKQWPKARVEMINAGVSGHTTTQGLARMERDVLAKKPHLVMVMFGMNDVVRVPLREFERNLAEIAARCERAGAAVVLGTPNSVTESPDRRNAKLEEYSGAVRRLAAARGWPLADHFADWAGLQQSDPWAWSLIMSEAIHPNLNGHRRFAERFASALAGAPVSLSDADAPPAPQPLAHTLARLQADQPVKIVAMPPYDRLVPERLRARYPKARLEVISWPLTDPAGQAEADPWSGGGRTAAKGFAKEIRDRKPHLVVVAPPAWVNQAADDDAFLADGQWLLNFAFPFATRQWDVIAVMPGVAEPGATFVPLRQEGWRRMILGKDLSPWERPPGDDRPVEALLDAWLFPAG